MQRVVPLATITKKNCLRIICSELESDFCKDRKSAFMHFNASDFETFKTMRQDNVHESSCQVRSKSEQLGNNWPGVLT